MSLSDFVGKCVAIFSGNTEKCLDIKNADNEGINKGMRCIFWDQHGRCNQQWTVTEEGENLFKIRNFENQEVCLDVFNNETANNTVVDTWAAEGPQKLNQLWSVVDGDAESGFVLEPAHAPGMALDYALHGDNKDSAIIWEKHGNDNQRFFFKEY